MAEITAAQVNTLREKTNVGMMNCKKALMETNGDIDAAVDLLRKRGMATAVKKASRDAKRAMRKQVALTPKAAEAETVEEEIVDAAPEVTEEVSESPEVAA